MALIKLSKPHSQIDIWSDLPDMAKQLKKAPMRMNRALATAMNSSGRVARAEASRQVGNKINVPTNKVKNRIRILKANAKNLRVALRARGRMLGLFVTKGSPPKQFPTGVKATAQTGKRTMIKGAFIATMRNRHKGVFMRAGSGTHRGSKPHQSELPIHELTKPSVAHTLMNKDVAPQVERAYRKVFKERLRQSINRQIMLMEQKFQKGKG